LAVREPPRDEARTEETSARFAPAVGPIDPGCEEFLRVLIPLARPRRTGGRLWPATLRDLQSRRFAPRPGPAVKPKFSGVSRDRASPLSAAGSPSGRSGR